MERWAGAAVLKAPLLNGSVVGFVLETAEKPSVPDTPLLLLFKTPIASCKDTKDTGFDDGGRVWSSRSPSCLPPLDVQQKTEKTRCHED